MTNRTKLALALLAVATSTIGCAPSLARSSAIGAADRAQQPPSGASEASPSDRCQSLSRAESTLRYVSVGAAVLGGGAGLSTIPTNDEVQAGLAITAAGFAVVAGTTEAVRAQLASDFVAEGCAE